MNKPRTSYFFRFIREFVLPHRSVCFLLVGNVLMQVGLGFWLPFAAKEMVDKVLGPAARTHHVDWHLAGWLILSVLGVILVTQFLVYHFNRLMFKLVAYISQNLRARVAAHLLSLSREYYDAAQLGRLAMTALGDPSNITQQLTMGMINALAQGFVVFGGCFILFQMNVALSLALVSVFPLMVLIFFVMRPRLSEHSEKSRENWGILSGMVTEKVGAIRLVRSFAAEDLETGRFKERVYRHATLNIHNSRLQAIYGFWNGITIHLGYMLVFLVGGLLYFKGAITLGTIVAFYGYFNRLFPAVLQICNLPQQVFSARGSLNKVFGLLDEPLAVVNLPTARRFEEPIIDIVFEGVTFSYGEGLVPALKDLNLRLEAGRQLGLVGPSGSGKSTLMALLLRFYEPSSGRILVNGLDIREWELQSLRRAFALVPQEMVLFTGSVRENLRTRKEALGDAEIWNALEEAEAADFVRAMPSGLDTRIGERGISLSGGQKQRLSIARALLSRPQCLILDNCTSALDGQTESRLQATLRRILQGRSAILISHRASSVIHCGQIVVLDAGRVVEQGTPKELLCASGYFMAIQRQQAGVG